jgi:hypothetical protein
MKKDKYRYDHLWIWVVFILLLGVLLLFGCASSKVKSSRWVKLDSTHLKAERSDSAGVKESTQIKKADSQEDNTIVIDFGDTGIYKPHPDSGLQDNGIYVWPKMAEDYFSISDKGEIKTSKIPARVIIKNLRQANTSDSITLKDMAKENHSKIEVSEVQKEEKKVEKAKYAFNLLWLLWFLLIPVGAWVWKNRWKIYQRLKMIVVKLLTGL